MRISGITIPENKKLKVSLTYVYGVGISRALKILQAAGVSPEKKTKELTPEEENKLRNFLGEYKIESDLRREILSNIRRLKDIKTYRGSRHAKNLPARGQRTKTNSRTTRPYRGRKTMTSGRRKLEKK